MLASSSRDVRNGEQDGLGRIVQPLQVFLQTKDLAAVHPDSLEDPVAVEEAVVVDRDHGRASVAPLAIQPDDWRAGALVGWGHGWLGADGHQGNVRGQSPVASPQPSVLSRHRLVTRDS